MRFLLILSAVLTLGACTSEATRTPWPPQDGDGAGATGPRVLCVIAHPDDETAFAATVYKIDTYLGGACDIAVITNGEGGFKYATLAERIYGLELTDEEVGRRNLPRIREGEMRAACRLLGVRHLFLLGQVDQRYTQDPEEVLAPRKAIWDLDFVRDRLRSLLREGGYDFVLTLAPVPETHGHHKAATILALEAVQALKPARRPVILCARTATKGEEAAALPGLPAYPLTGVREDVGPWVFERTQKFGFKNRLDYHIVVNWVIASHVSQGTMQLAMNRGDEEQFFMFQLNAADAPERASRLFRALQGRQFRSRVYGPSGGTNALGR